MKKNIYIIISFSIFFSYISSKNLNQNNRNKRNVIHFIKCGSGDAILIEGNGHFGLIDTSNPYQYMKNEVVKVNIDKKKGEKNWWEPNPINSVQAVLNYLKSLNVKKLDFILGTHAHSDHIGGIGAIAYKYVDKSTIYYYKKYRKTMEDFDKKRKSWANYKYYLAAVNSMKKKNAKLIDITNKIIKFKFGDMDLEFFNTERVKNELKIPENKYCIVTLIKFRKTKIFLASDMIEKDDKRIKDYLGKIDVLKLSHHGYSETSFDFLNITKPDYVIISNEKFYNHTFYLVKYMEVNFNPKIYSTSIIKEPAIRLYFNLEGKKEFYFDNKIEYKLPNYINITIFDKKNNRNIILTILLFLISIISIFLFRKEILIFIYKYIYFKIITYKNKNININNKNIIKNDENNNHNKPIEIKKTIN